MPTKAAKPDHKSALLDDDEGFVRKRGVLRLYPVGERSWDRGVKERRYPAPVRISKRIQTWRVSDIKKPLATVAETGG
jgi:predicted DNA-binding transcriptional regulator AlpA